MTTFSDDFIQLELEVGTRRIPLDVVGLTWPPPERLWLDGGGLRIANNDDDPDGILVRKSMSIITDEQRAEMTNVMRGALYVYEAA